MSDFASPYLEEIERYLRGGCNGDSPVDKFIKARGYALQLAGHCRTLLERAQKAEAIVKLIADATGVDPAASPSEFLLWMTEVHDSAVDQRDALAAALRDMHAGWQYIRQNHGDLYGVGWDRCDASATAALAALESPTGPQLNKENANG